MCIAFSNETASVTLLVSGIGVHGFAHLVLSGVLQVALDNNVLDVEGVVTVFHKLGFKISDREVWMLCVAGLDMDQHWHQRPFFFAASRLVCSTSTCCGLAGLASTNGGWLCVYCWQVITSPDVVRSDRAVEECFGSDMRLLFFFFEGKRSFFFP